MLRWGKNLVELPPVIHRSANSGKQRRFGKKCIACMLQIHLGHHQGPQL
jgi:hypothetical protein